MPKDVYCVDKDLLAWVVNEVRDLDAACRSQIPGFDPFNSEEMEKLIRLEKIVK